MDSEEFDPDDLDAETPLIGESLWYKRFNMMKAEDSLLEKLERYEEALKWYANEKNFFPRKLLILAQEQHVKLAPVYGDLGDIARRALGTEEGKL